MAEDRKQKFTSLEKHSLSCNGDGDARTASVYVVGDGNS